MKRRVVMIWVILLLWGGFIVSEVSGHSQLSTRALEELQNSFTDGGLWGAPRYTTATLPTCGSSNTGAIAFDTTAGSIVVCSGSAWE